MGPETKLKIRLMPKLRAIGTSWWEKIQQRAIKGTPDLLGCLPCTYVCSCGKKFSYGAFVALELKSSKGRLSALQSKVLQDIQRAGGFAQVVSPENEKEVIDVLEEFTQSGPVDDL